MPRKDATTERRPNPKPLAGDHSRVCTRDLAIRRSKHDVMVSLAQSAPRNPCFCGIKVAVGDGDQNGSHAVFANE